MIIHEESGKGEKSMEQRYKLFIVEDDFVLAEEMKKALDKWGFEARVVEDFNNILKNFLEQAPHAVLMDINIPSFDGFYWCKKIREVSSVPIIFVSSRESNMDVIMAINNGGDDYIQKPFDISVLVAKLQAIMRRTYEYGRGEESVLQCQGLLLNLNDATMQANDQIIELTKNEFKILKLLIQNRGKVVSRQLLMKKLWDDDVYVNENTLTVNVNRLRTKLGELGFIDFISTKKGMGYMVL